jgi:hypothetical protein
MEKSDFDDNKAYLDHTLTGSSSVNTTYIPPFPSAPKRSEDFPVSDSPGDELPILTHNDEEIAKFLDEELSCQTLDELTPQLHYVARKSSSHIDPLHLHILKGRSIIITENPSLHLVWYSKTLYLKPLPEYLFNYNFWDKHLIKSSLPQTSSRRAAALGFGRSYGHLIRHKSDFHLALQHNLLPSHLTYPTFLKFIKPFLLTPDNLVSPRYTFGQLRLSRLNWAIRIFQPSSRHGKGILQRLYYQERFWQTGQIFEEFGPLLLGVFASLEIALSAMQVVIGAYQVDPWRELVRFCWGVSVAVMVLLGVVLLGFLVLPTVVVFLQVRFARREKRRWRLKDSEAMDV